jgi:hypothetical protein
LKSKPGARQEGGSAQHTAADAAQKKRVEEKMCASASFQKVGFLTQKPRQSLRLQLQETDSLFQSTKAQQDEYLKKIASLEAERDRLKEQVAELEEITRDLYTHLSTSRCDDFALEYSRSLCLVATAFNLFSGHCPTIRSSGARKSWFSPPLRDTGSRTGVVQRREGDSAFCLFKCL